MVIKKKMLKQIMSEVKGDIPFLLAGVAIGFLLKEVIEKL